MLRCVLPCPVKGAGVAGLAVVDALVARGAEITVFDPHPGFSAAASWLAGGMLAPWCERESADEAVLREGQDAPDRWEAVLPGVVKRIEPPRRDRGTKVTPDLRRGYDAATAVGSWRH
jgi:glycine oxidase